jgi:catechol 2,3-dioxygenase-like lactoylglutathione lyase family enzyme
MSAKLWHITVVVENMELMRDFYTRVIGLEETTRVLFEDSETGSPTPGAIPIPGLNEWHGVSRDVKIAEQNYKDEDHDLSLALMKFHNKPSEKLDKSAMSPFFGGHVGYLIDDLPSALQRMGEEQLGGIIKTRGPDGAPNPLFISDPEGNAVLYSLRTRA